MEKRLSRVCRKIKETEVKARLFDRMVREDVATADVRNFVHNQTKLKRVNKAVHLPTARDLKNVLNSEHNYSKSKCRKMIRSSMERAEYHKNRHIKCLKRKFKHCKSKMDDITEHITESLTENVNEIVEGVNIFHSEVVPEKVQIL